MTPVIVLLSKPLKSIMDEHVVPVACVMFVYVTSETGQGTMTGGWQNELLEPNPELMTSAPPLMFPMAIFENLMSLTYPPRYLLYLMFNPLFTCLKSQSCTVMLFMPPDISEPMATPAAREKIAVTLRIIMLEQDMLYL